MSTNRIVPEVYAELVRDKVVGKCKVAQFLVTKGELHNDVGEQINFPSWSYIGDAKDWNIDTPMEVSKMKQTEKTAKVKAIHAPAVEVRDYDDLTALGNAVEEASTQQAISIARKYDTDAIKCALTSPLKSKLAAKNKVTQEELISMMGLYGDDRDSADFDAIVIHSAFAPSFYTMDMFVKRDLTMTAEGNGVAVNGIIGTFLNIPVVLSDNLYDAENQEGFILMMKKGAIAYCPKELPFAETERVANLRKTNIYLSQIYAMALVDETAIVFAKNVLPS